MPIPRILPEAAGLDPTRLGRLIDLIHRHIDDGLYPGAQIAFARHGKLALLQTIGSARQTPQPVPANDRDLWLLFSMTKPLVAAGVWMLVERGLVRFADRIAEVVPGFEANAKGDITLAQVLTHQGGFPSATVPEQAWEDHDLLRQAVCDFRLEWTPGSRVQYHPGSGGWVLAVLIETLTGKDFRTYLRDELFVPLGLADTFLGVPPSEQQRCADMEVLRPGPTTHLEWNSPAARLAGFPSGGGYATAADLAGFYQMLLQNGTLNGARVLGPRMIEYVTRNHTGERVDEAMGMPMHRGLGVHVRGV